MLWIITVWVLLIGTSCIGARRYLYLPPTHHTFTRKTGVLIHDIANHPAVLGRPTSYHISINLWNTRREEADDVADFAIHRFAPMTQQATRRQLKENLATRGQVVLQRVHDVKYGTVQGDPAAIVRPD